MALPPFSLKTISGHEDIKLESIKVDGKELDAAGYAVAPTSLTLHAASIPSGEWELELTTRIRPQDNTALEGLYKSGGMFCTQCEAEGFRHITYFLDRPDVMAKWVVVVVGWLLMMLGHYIYRYICESIYMTISSQSHTSPLTFFNTRSGTRRGSRRTGPPTPCC